MFQINDKVAWIGKIDWELRRFHGDEYSTHRGSSYNSYLIQDQKTVLIDTVWTPFAKEYITNLKKTTDLKRIDYIIVNHSEVDHSGALPELMRLIPETPIICTENGAKLLKAHYHEDWKMIAVKTGDTLDLGENKLYFVEARMLHWPDSMMTYLTGEGILFSNDAFGQHFASEHMYNDKVDPSELYQEALKYYANILTPFSALVTKKIEELLSLKIPVSMICPSHGVIWREDPLQIVNQYIKWAKGYKENQVTILYDTMWNATRTMAESIAAGIKEKDNNVTIKIFNCSHTDKNDIITEIFKSRMVVMGSSTINRGILSALAAILEMTKGLGFKKKKAAVFGSYGWSGESTKIIAETLSASGFEVVNEGLKLLWTPDEEGIGKCKTFGNELADTINAQLP
ncbi:MAG: anaerobic nitric oxide reductase flavorubredoxin [Eubacteriales bacterium]|nr:anaerobic nitric oxide reductase flavorubredoxin [Eubacteriales bacterium]